MNDMYAVKLHDIATINTIAKKEPDEKLLAFCYRQIECDCIEIVRPEILPEPYIMIVDEEGLLRDTPVLNFIASYLHGAQNHGQPIVGKALIMKEVETDDGMEIAWLDYEEAFTLMNALDAVVPAAVTALYRNAR